MFVFLLTLGESIQSCIIKYNVRRRFFVDALYQIEKVPLIPIFSEHFYHEWMLKFVKYFCILRSFLNLKTLATSSWCVFTSLYVPLCTLPKGSTLNFVTMLRIEEVFLFSIMEEKYELRLAIRSGFYSWFYLLLDECDHILFESQFLNLQIGEK